MTRTLYEFNKSHLSMDTSDTRLRSFVSAMDVSAFREGDVQQLQNHQVSAISLGNAIGRILIGN